MLVCGEKGKKKNLRNQLKKNYIALIRNRIKTSVLLIGLIRKALKYLIVFSLYGKNLSQDIKETKNFPTEIFTSLEDVSERREEMRMGGHRADGRMAERRKKCRIVELCSGD